MAMEQASTNTPAGRTMLASRPAPSHQGTDMAGRTKILVVEDEPVTAALMTFLLTRAGHEVETVFTGREGMDLGTTRKFDLILLDVELPGINGLDICRELKQRWIAYQTPIIVMSSSEHEERRGRAFKVGAADFIAKPFVADDFLARIAPCLPPAQNRKPSP